MWSRPPETKPEAGGPGEVAKWWPDAWKPDEGLVGAPADARGVAVLEGIKPFKAQELARKLSSKTKKTPDEDRALAAAQAEIAGYVVALSRARVIVVHHDIVYAWVDVLRDWSPATLIIDELHAYQGYKSRRTDAVVSIAQVTRRRMGLTGTPMTSRPRDLHSVMNVLCPGRFGYFFAGDRQGVFARLFCGAFQETVGKGQHAKTVWNFDGASNLDEPDGKTAVTVEETLHHRLSYCMLRRVKSQVDDQLPPKTRQIVDVTIPSRHDVAPSMKMLEVGTGRELRRCLDLAADGKLKPVIDLVKAHLEEGEKVICFCYRRMFAEAVAAATGGLVIHGGIPQAKRDRRIAELRTQSGPGVICATIDTTSTGIDLSFASAAVVGELTWEPHELAQMEERLYKFGAGAGGTKSLIQYVIARGTGDELILRGVVSKLDLFERAIGPTGDRMKEDLGEKRQEDALAALTQTLLAMDQEVEKTGKRKRVRA